MATLSIPHPVPSAAEDAEQIRKACQGWGTDEKSLISVLAHRDAAQRRQIAETYESLYKENLTKRLESEISGDFEKAVYRWLLAPVEREAVLANIAAVKQKTIDYRVIIETAWVHSTEELLGIKRAYQGRFKRSMEEDVAAHSSGDLRRFLLAILGTYRYDGGEVDVGLALTEAKILKDAIAEKEKAASVDEITRVLATRSRAQLIATFNKFKDEFGVTVTKNLDTHTQNDVIFAFRIAIRCIISPQKYFEKVLRTAANKAVADEDALTRVIVTRAERDLRQIKEKYFQRTNVTLDQAVGKATSGHYKSFLLALIGN